MYSAAPVSYFFKNCCVAAPRYTVPAPESALVLPSY